MPFGCMRKAPPHSTVTLKVRISTCEVGEGKHSVHGREFISQLAQVNYEKFNLLYLDFDCDYIGRYT